MHIVYLINNPFMVSGGTRVISEHTSRLSAKGHTVEIWHTAVEDSVSSFKNCVPISRLDVTKLNNPDVVVMCDPAFLPYVITNRQKNGLFLLLQHDIESITSGNVLEMYSGLMREICLLVRARKCEIIVVSKWVQKAVADRYNLKAVVIENGIDDRLFAPTTPYLKTPNPTVLLVYDPQPWKRADYAINILLEVHRKVTDLEVIILSTVLLSMPQEQTRAYRFPMPVVIFSGQPQDRLASIYSSADVFLSTSKLEGFCLPILEAFACGVPVVSTNNGGSETFAINNKTALIIPQNDVEKSARTVRKLLTNKELQTNLRRQALDTSMNYKWDKSIDSLEEMLVNYRPIHKKA